MKNYEQTKFWFSSIIGFFYQLGIDCDVDKNKALELYLLVVDNDSIPPCAQKIISQRIIEVCNNFIFRFSNCTNANFCCANNTFDKNQVSSNVTAPMRHNDIDYVSWHLI